MSTTPTPPSVQYPQVTDNVATLVEHTQILAESSRDRTKHADTRAGGLAVLANGLLALGVTANDEVRAFAPHATWHHVVLGAYLLGLLVLLFAGVQAARALRLTAAPAFRATDLARYKGPTTQRARPVDLQRQLLRGWIATVNAESIAYDTKLRLVVGGYRLFAIGLALLVAVIGRISV